MSLSRSIRQSLRNIFEYERFLRQGPCPTVRHCLAVYPALFINDASQIRKRKDIDASIKQLEARFILRRL